MLASRAVQVIKANKSSVEDVDIELFKTILSEIRIDKNGSVSLHLVNNAIVEHSERGDCV